MNWRTSLGCLLILVCLTGCSSFNSRWQQVNAQQAAAPTNLTGAWDGHWRSDMNGHNGRLRAIFTDGEPGTIHARFHAVYWGILRFTSIVQLTVTESEGVHQLEGAADLAGWAGGRYEYNGTATPTSFKCTYRSKHDHGVFELSRP
jgi:hypothetical protein